MTTQSCPLLHKNGLVYAQQPHQNIAVVVVAQSVRWHAPYCPQACLVERLSRLDVLMMTSEYSALAMVWRGMQDVLGMFQEKQTTICAPSPLSMPCCLPLPLCHCTIALAFTPVNQCQCLRCLQHLCHANVPLLDVSYGLHPSSKSVRRFMLWVPSVMLWCGSRKINLVMDSLYGSHTTGLS